MTTLGEEAISEIHQFISMVRARIAGAIEEGGGESEPERLWREAYGRLELESGSTEELLTQVGGILHDKLTVAAVVVVELLLRLSEATDRSDLIGILDEVEAKFTEDLTGRE